jgi:hypothetical protein
MPPLALLSSAQRDRCHANGGAAAPVCRSGRFNWSMRGRTFSRTQLPTCKTIASNANLSDISQVSSALFTNPLGVISALTNLDPTTTTDTAPLPITVGVELTPALELALAQLGEEGATLTAINDVIGQLEASA